MEIPKRKTSLDIRECVIVMLDSICIDRSWDQFAVCGCQVFYPKHLKMSQHCIKIVEIVNPP